MEVEKKEVKDEEEVRKYLNRVLDYPPGKKQE